MDQFDILKGDDLIDLEASTHLHLVFCFSLQNDFHYYYIDIDMIKGHFVIIFLC